MAKNFVSCFIDSKNDNEPQKYAEILSKNADIGLDVVVQAQLLEWASTKDFAASPEIKSLLAAKQPVPTYLVASVLPLKFEELAKAREDRILDPTKGKTDAKAKPPPPKDPKKDKAQSTAPPTTPPTELLKLPVDPTGLRHAFILQGFATTPQDISNLLQAGVDVDAFFVIDGPLPAAAPPATPAKPEKAGKEKKGKEKEKEPEKEIPVVKLCDAVATEQKALKSRHLPSPLRDVPMIVVEYRPPDAEAVAAGVAPESAMKDMAHAVTMHLRDALIRKRAYVEQTAGKEYQEVPSADGSAGGLGLYEKLLRDVPDSCVSVPLILHCLLEQVAYNESSDAPPSVTPLPQEATDVVPTAALTGYLDSALSKLTGQLSLGGPGSARADPALQWSENSQISLLRHGDAISTRNQAHADLMLNSTATPTAVEHSMLQIAPVLCSPHHVTLLPQTCGPHTLDASSVHSHFPFLFPRDLGTAAAEAPESMLSPRERGASVTELFHFVGKEVEPPLLERELLLFELEGMLARCDPSRVWSLEDRTWAEDFNKETLLQTLARHVQLTQPEVYLQPFALLDSLLAVLHTKVPLSRVKSASMHHHFPETPNFSAFFESSSLSAAEIIAAAAATAHREPALPSDGTSPAPASPAPEAAPVPAVPAPPVSTDANGSSSAVTGADASAQNVIQSDAAEEPQTDVAAQPSNEKRLVVNGGRADVKEECTLMYPSDGAIINVSAFTSPEANEVQCTVVHDDAVFGFHSKKSSAIPVPNVCFKAGFDDGRVMVSVREVIAPPEPRAPTPAEPQADGQAPQVEVPQPQEVAAAVPAPPVDQEPQTPEQQPAEPAAAALPPALTLEPILPPRLSTELAISFPNGARVCQLGSDYILQSRGANGDKKGEEQKQEESVKPSMFLTASKQKADVSGGAAGDVIEVCTWVPKKKVSKVAVKETSRAFISKGTVVRYFEGGQVQCLFADGAVSTRNTDGTWLVTDFNGKRSIKSPFGDVECLPSLLIAQNIDPETRAIVRTREDLVMTVMYKDAQSRMTQHLDGTRMWSEAGCIRIESGSDVVRDDAYFPVVMFPEEGHSSVELPDRALLMCFYDMSMHLTMSDGAKVNVDLQSKRVSMEPASLLSTAPELESELGACGVYTFGYSEGGMVTSDYEGNSFLVDPSGSHSVQLSASHQAAVAAAFQHPEHTQTPEDLDTALRLCSEAAGNAVPATHHPRLFVIRRDGSGTELLRFDDVQSFLGRAKNNPKQTTILDEPVNGSKSTRSYTFLSKEAEPIASQMSQRPIPRCVIPLPKPKSLKPDKEILFFRQLVEYQMLDEQKRLVLRESAAKWSEWSRKRDAYDASSPAPGAGRTPEEIEEEKQVQEIIRTLIESRRTPSSTVESVAIEQYHKAKEAAVPLPPPEPQPAPTDAAQKKAPTPLPEPHPTPRARAVVVPPGERPSYWDSEEGQQFLTGSAERREEDSQMRHSSSGHLEPPRYQRQKTEKLTQSIRQQSTSPSPTKSNQPPLPLPPQQPQPLRAHASSPVPNVFQGERHVSVGGTHRVPKPRDTSPGTSDLSPPKSIAGSTKSSTKSLSQTMPSDVYGRPRAAVPAVQSLKKNTAVHEPNQKYESIEGPSRRQVNTASINLIKIRREPSPTRDASPEKVPTEVLEADGANFAVTPARVNFGDLYPGFSYRFALQLSNLGTQSGRFRVKPFSTPAITLHYKKGSVAPGMTIKMELEVQAKDECVIDDVLEIVAEHRIIRVPFSAVVSESAPADKLRKGIYVV